MFLLNGQPLPLDTPFDANGVQYPANWLRLTSAEEKAAIGITEVADPAPHDDRFYWAPGVPKDLDQLKKQMTEQVKATAGSLLAPTEWKIVRAASDANEAAIAACTSVDALAALQMTWPVDDEV
jgi:hypothetical protein